jgi:flagellar protein FliO/FliZ
VAELAVRMVVSLAVVVGLLLLIAKFSQKRFKGRSGSPLQVLHRQSLSRSSGVALVSVGGRMLLLGTTDNQVQMLTEVDPADVTGAVEDTSVETPVAAPAVPVQDSLLGSMAGQIEEPTRWAPPGAKRKLAPVPAPVVTAAPVVVAAPVPAPAAPAAPSFAATLEAELAAEQRVARVPAAELLTPAQVLLAEEADQSPLAGSLLSPDTWRLAARAVTRRAS